MLRPLAFQPQQVTLRAWSRAQVCCKRSGQRWRNPGLRATLACRTQLVNGRLDRAMLTLRRRDYSADVQAVSRLAA